MIIFDDFPLVLALGSKKNPGPSSIILDPGYGCQRAPTVLKTSVVLCMSTSLSTTITILPIGRKFSFSAISMA
jgi:hypothetical protein